MKHTARLMVAAAVVASLIGSSAWAGIADSPLPVLVAGKKTLLLYSVPGIISDGGLASFFSCTSTDTAPMQVGVELFFAPGGAPANDAVATSLSVAPGARVIFATGGAAGISIDSNLGGFETASARILATSKKLACTAFVADQSNSPPSVAWQLTIIAKLKQKAAN